MRRLEGQEHSDLSAGIKSAQVKGDVFGTCRPLYLRADPVPEPFLYASK